MKNLLLILAIILVPITFFGQSSPTELYQTGKLNFKSGNYAKAVENFSNLIELVDENNVKKTCYVNRELSYDRLQKYDLAIADFTKAIKIDSTDMASFIDRGLSKMHAGNLKEAKEDYNYVVSENNDHRMMEAAIYWLARIHYSQGQFEEAIRNCDQYFKINPQDPEMYFIRGTANDMLRYFHQSISDYDKAIEIKADYTKAFANRGTAKINLLTGSGNLQPSIKETESACKDLKKAKELGDNAVDDLIFVYCKLKKRK